MGSEKSEHVLRNYFWKSCECRDVAFSILPERFDLYIGPHSLRRFDWDVHNYNLHRRGAAGKGRTNNNKQNLLDQYYFYNVVMCAANLILIAAGLTGVPNVIA